MFYLLLGSVIVNCVQGMFALSHTDEVAQLRDEITYLQSRIPKHDSKGRFAKKA